MKDKIEQLVTRQFKQFHSASAKILFWDKTFLLLTFYSPNLHERYMNY